jgi:hypothetical protein
VKSVALRLLNMLIAVLLVSIIGLGVLSWHYARERERRSIRVLTFTTIGKSVAAHVAADRSLRDKSLEELQAKGILSASDAKWLRRHHIEYFPPPTDATAEFIIFRFRHTPMQQRGVVVSLGGNSYYEAGTEAFR